MGYHDEKLSQMLFECRSRSRLFDLCVKVIHGLSAGTLVAVERLTSFVDNQIDLWRFEVLLQNN